MTRAPISNGLASVADWVARAERQLRSAKLFFGHGTHRARDEAFWIASHALGCTFDDLVGAPGKRLTLAERIRADELVSNRIATRKPLAYLIGEAWLAGNRFYVDERVIVPRSFIAEGLETTIPAWISGRVSRALDLCTGSACLAILMARQFRTASIDAVDISAGALDVARINVKRYRLSRRIRLLQSDLFARLAGCRYDLIVSNPPYVDAASMRSLPQEYKHEPELALAGGKDGLELVRRLLVRAPRHLVQNGLLVCEIGHNRRILERTFPRIPFVWISTQTGSEEVFLVSREDLVDGLKADG